MQIYPAYMHKGKLTSRDANLPCLYAHSWNPARSIPAKGAVPPARGKLLFLVWEAGYAPRKWPRQVSGVKTERPWARISPKRARQVLVSERKLRIATFAVAVYGWREIYPLVRLFIETPVVYC